MTGFRMIGLRSVGSWLITPRRCCAVVAVTLASVLGTQLFAAAASASEPALDNLASSAQGVAGAAQGVAGTVVTDGSNASTQGGAIAQNATSASTYAAAETGHTVDTATAAVSHTVALSQAPDRTSVAVPQAADTAPAAVSKVPGTTLAAVSKAVVSKPRAAGVVSYVSSLSPAPAAQRRAIVPIEGLAASVKSAAAPIDAKAVATIQPLVRSSSDVIEQQRQSVERSLAPVARAVGSNPAGAAVADVAAAAMRIAGRGTQVVAAARATTGTMVAGTTAATDVPIAPSPGHPQLGLAPAMTAAARPGISGATLEAQSTATTTTPGAPSPASGASSPLPWAHGVLGNGADQGFYTWIGASGGAANASGGDRGGAPAIDPGGPASPSPAPSGGAPAATAGASGTASSILLMLAVLAMLGGPRARRRLRLASEPWQTAPFVLIPERPG